MSATHPDQQRDRPRRRSSAPLGLLLALLVAAVGSIGMISATDRSEEAFRCDSTDPAQDCVETEIVVDGELVEALATVDGPATNYLIIGSDSREGADPDAVDAGAVGDVEGRRSDTIIVLRTEEDGGGAALLSLNRDLWVTQADTGRQDRINAAYSRGAGVLAATITEEYGIPINHVVDVDFVGFRALVDTIGGVELCFDVAVRDLASGLDQPPGCSTLDGTQALGYARSRRFEEFRDSDWRQDQTADIGRVLRQQQFISAAVDQTIADVAENPRVVRELLDSTDGLIRLDDTLEPLQVAGTLRQAFSTGLTTFTLPSQGAMIDGKSVLTFVDGPEAQAILEYFRGNAPLPVPATTVPG